jgi:proline racemase
MDARRYPFLCGHATIGAVATLIETGALEVSGPETRIVVDTPSGPMETTAFVTDDRVQAVAVRAVPSFVYGSDLPLEVPGLGRIRVDTVCVGGFFVMVSASQTGLPLTPENRPKLIELGMEVIDAANRQIEVRHPLRPEVRTVDVVEFYDTFAHGEGEGSSVVVYGESHVDRSPCGTGTAAKLTLLHHRGRIRHGEPFHNYGPLGTRFEARIVEETRVGGLTAVVAEIRSSAQITGFHEFVLDPHDPFPQGFLI